MRKYLLAAAAAAGVPANRIGTTGGTVIRLSVNGKVAVETPVETAETAWQTAIERRMARRKSGEDR